MTGLSRLLTLGLLLALPAPQAARAQMVGHASLVPLGNLNHTSVPVPTAVSGGAATSFNTAYFVGNDAEHGTEVWRWSGSGAATLFSDVRPGPESGNPEQFTAMGSVVLWVANDGVRGPEIRGSQALPSTSSLMDLQPGAAHAPPQILGASGGVVWFSTSSWQDGYPITALWSMATFGDPVKVGVYARDSIQQVSTVPGQPHLFFIARAHGTDPQHRLYRVNGIQTARMIESLDPAATGAVPPAGSYAATPDYVCYRQVSGGFLLRMALATGGFSTLTQQSDETILPWFVSNGVDRVCFAARTNATGVELWTTLGTPASTTLLADVVPGTASSNPSRLMMSAGNPGVFFQVDKGAGRDLYFVDAKELPAPVPRKLRSAVQTSTQFAIVDADEIVLNVPDNNVTSLWLADGRTGTGQWLGPLFSSVARIWNPSQQMPPARQLNVVGTASSTGEELYRLEDTATLGLLSLSSGSASASPRQFFPWSSEQLFVADTDSGKGRLLRVGPSAAPSMIGQATPPDVQGNSASSHPADFTECGNVLLFTAHDGTSRRLYMSAEGQPGSAMVVDGIHNPEQLVLFQGRVFMLGAPAANSTGVKKLYQAEAVGSTVTVDAFDQGKHVAMAVVAAAGRLFFVEPMGGGTEWLRTVLPDLSLGDSAIFYQDATGAGITQLTAAAGRLYFSALSHPVAKRVVWATDGALTNTRTPDPVLERPQLLGVLGGSCVFWRAPSTGMNYELYVWDGESTTSVLYQGGGPLTDTPEPSRIAGRPAGVEFAGRFHFADQSGSLLSTDGTGIGISFDDSAVLVRPEALAVINNRLLFWGTGRNNESLFFTLPETGGLQFLRTFSARSLPCPFVKVGGRLHFTLAHLEANLGETELWQTDGTQQGTALDLQVVQARENAYLHMGAFRGHLVLGAINPKAPSGVEPMLLNYDPSVPQPLTLTGALRGKPFFFTYADIVTGPVVDVEGDTLSPLRLTVGTGTLTRNGSAVSGGTEISPGDTFVWTPEPADSGLLYAFQLAASDPWNEGQSYVCVRVDSPLDVWAQGHFTEEELADPAIAGPEADADGDGVSNALEFVFGRHPRTATAEPACAPSKGETQGGAKVVRFTFVRTAVLAEGTVLTVQTSPDLAPDSWLPVATRNSTDSWMGSGAVSEITLPDGRVQVTVEMPEPAAGRVFMRLGVGL